MSPPSWLAAEGSLVNMIYYPVGMPVGSSSGDSGLEVTVCVLVGYLRVAVRAG